ncbi:MAG: type II/IV secretion system ATPase subunit [Candidatus Woesearchaeota archaeon]
MVKKRGGHGKSKLVWSPETKKTKEKKRRDSQELTSGVSTQTSSKKEAGKLGAVKEEVKEHLEGDASQTKSGDALQEKQGTAKDKKKLNKKNYQHSAFDKQERLDENSDRIIRLLDEYHFNCDNMPITIRVYTKEGEFVPIYEVSIASISKTTEMILEQIRKKLIKEVTLGMVEIINPKETGIVEEKFKETIAILVKKYFPDVDDETKGYLTTYLIQKSLGMGNIDILMHDVALEEIVINSVEEPVWVYHKKHGWLKSNIFMPNDDQTKHYAAMIGRRVGRQISILEPLLDAHLSEGDRVNATIMPISTRGNTITIRKFSRDPFTITKFLQHNTISTEAAALIWLCMQYELSAIIAGGTASGKTSALNVLASFFPPNQRIISIEDTREIRLPKFLHWVPMNTRLPNTEGKGEVTMEDLLVNSLRMRPDRILVGEVRRKREAETLFEAIHTGHSCYATFHANTAEETVNRLTNPPIEVPKSMMPAISLIIVQFRNRRTGLRRTFQIAEILPDASVNVIMQYDPKEDKLKKVKESKALMQTLQLFTGHSPKEIQNILKTKEEVLNYLVRNNIDTVDGVGRVMAEYYTNYENLLKYVRANKKLA